MPTQTFDEAEREAYARYRETLDADALARCFHLDERDRTLIASLRGDHNRAGFAAQLGTVRLLGVLPGEDTAVPAVAVTALARQIGVRVPDLAPYWAGRQRWRHAGLIRTHYGYRDFDAAPDARFRLTRWLYALCWTGDDRPGLLLERALGWLLGAKILLPGRSGATRAQTSSDTTNRVSSIRTSHFRRVKQPKAAEEIPNVHRA